MDTKLEVATTAGIEKIVPKPTKKQIRLAMAKAIQAEQTTAREAWKGPNLAEREKIEAEVAEFCRRHGQVSEVTHFGDGSETYHYLKVKLKVPPGVPGAAALLKSLDRVTIDAGPKVQKIEEIVSALAEAERERQGDAVDLMLADPECRASLLKVGTNLLNSATPNGPTIEV